MNSTRKDQERSVCLLSLSKVSLFALFYSLAFATICHLLWKPFAYPCELLARHANGQGKYEGEGEVNTNEPTAANQWGPCRAHHNGARHILLDDWHWVRSTLRTSQLHHVTFMLYLCLLHRALEAEARVGQALSFTLDEPAGSKAQSTGSSAPFTYHHAA